MARLIDAADEVVTFLVEQGWACCLVGGMVVPRWGEPRATADVDICRITGLGDEAQFISAILGRFQPRIENAAQFAERARVLLIRSSNGIDIDIALGWTPFERNMLHRASAFQFTRNIELPTASAEDIRYCSDEGFRKPAARLG